MQRSYFRISASIGLQRHETFQRCNSSLMGRALPPLQDISQHTGRGGRDYSAPLRQTHTKSTDSFHGSGGQPGGEKTKQTEREPQVPFLLYFSPLFFTSVSEAGLKLPTFPPLLQHLTEESLFGTCAGGKDALQGRWSDKGQREVTSGAGALLFTNGSSRQMLTVFL